MRKTKLAAAAVLLAGLGASAALADDDCSSASMAEWQPRNEAVAAVEAFGWKVGRVKVEDGCYEVKGRDADGNEVEATLDPVTLALVKLEVEFRPGADPSRYVTGARPGEAAPGEPAAPPANGLFENGATPRAVVE
jgi:hypothetical protein